MRAIVINLCTKTERRVFQTEQLKRLALEHDFFDAITPKTLPDYYRGLDRTKWQRTLSENELACLASHREVWHEIANGQEPALVLEDDAIISQHAPDFLKALEDRHDLMHVSLESHGRKKLLSKNAYGGTELSKLHRLYQDRSGAAAYVLWPKGAEILIRRSEGKVALADALIATTYQLKSHQCVPALAIQADKSEQHGIETPLHTASSLSNSNNDIPHKSFGQTMSRLRAQFMLAQRQLSKAPFSTRKKIGFLP